MTQQSLDNHPLIKSKTSILANLNRASSGYRHVQLAVYDANGVRTKEANEYIDSRGRFKIGTTFLDLEGKNNRLSR